MKVDFKATAIMFPENEVIGMTEIGLKENEIKENEIKEKELKEKAFAIGDLIKDTSVSDETIIAKIKEAPELINAKLRTGMTPFVAAVSCKRLSVAKELSDMGADIHWTCAACEGNALNVARTPEQADEILALGVKIEKNLLLTKPFKNPAIVSALNNNKIMMFYWLNKQKEIFAEDEKYVQELLYETIRAASIINQYGMLSSIIADEELFLILKDIYSKEDDVKSIQLYNSALRRIDDKNLDAGKKELRKILNVRKKELLSVT